MQNNAQENKSDEMSKASEQIQQNSLSSVKAEEFLDVTDVISLHEVLQKWIRLPGKQKTKHHTGGRTLRMW